jgi:IS30 family transposase
MPHTHLASAERHKIQTLREEGYTQEEIAARIGKDQSVISRELRRNKDEPSEKTSSLSHHARSLRERLAAAIMRFESEFSARLIDSSLGVCHHPT